jgi:hypothetical protein
MYLATVKTVQRNQEAAGKPLRSMKKRVLEHLIFAIKRIHKK